VRFARAIGVIGFSCVVGFGCAVREDYAPRTYVVQPRDTLYSIAWRHDLDYRELARWNNIGPDYRIAVGQILVLKAGAGGAARAAPSTLQKPAVQPANAPRSSAPPPSAGAKPHSGAGTGAGPAVPAPGVAAEAGSLLWLWPTAHSDAPRPVPGGGILLFGQLGQPVRAACSGRIVYVGSGLRGYGNLIIIKHGDNLLSAYAHTRELGVHEGQDVAAGQVIAEMGTGPHQIAALYFEIRLNGKPVDPLPYLPATKP
jgi:lipoprotein NlpD